jgi:hypothetical protein
MKGGFPMRPEEEEIIYCLQQFGTLRHEQIISFINKDHSVTEKIIQSLIKSCYIFETGNKSEYLSTVPDNGHDVDQRTIMAFWVMIQFSDGIRPHDYYAENMPFQIFFIKDEIQYEIAVYQSGDELLAAIIENRARNSDEDGIVIFAVKDEGLLQEIPELTRETIFAVVKDKGVRLFRPRRGMKSKNE